MTRWQAVVLSASGTIGVALVWLATNFWLLMVVGVDLEYEQRQQAWLKACALGFTCMGVLQAALARLPLLRAVLWVVWQVVSLAALVNLFPIRSWTTVALGLLSPVALQVPLVLLAGAANWNSYKTRSFIIGTSIWPALMLTLLCLNVSIFADYNIACSLLAFLLPLRDVGLIVHSARHPQERASLPLRWFAISASVALLLAVGCSSGALLSYTSRTTPLAFRRLDRVSEFLSAAAEDAAFTYRTRGSDWVSRRARISHPPFENELERIRYEARQVWSVAVRIDPGVSPQWTKVGAFESRDDHHLDPAAFRMPPLDGWLADLDRLIDSFFGRNRRVIRDEDREMLVPREWGELKETPVTIRKKSGHPYPDYVRTVYPKVGVVLMVVYE